MKPELSKVYLEAAKRIVAEEDEFSCCAVDSALSLLVGKTLRYSFQRSSYAYAMSSRDGRPIDTYDFFGMDRAQKRELRLWLLCMMAACCEDMPRYE